MLAEVRANDDRLRADARRHHTQRLLEGVHTCCVAKRNVEAVRGNEHPGPLFAVKKTVEGVNAAAKAECGFTRRRLVELCALGRVRLKISRGLREQFRVTPPLAPDFQKLSYVRQP